MQGAGTGYRIGFPLSTAHPPVGHSEKIAMRSLSFLDTKRPMATFGLLEENGETQFTCGLEGSL